MSAMPTDLVGLDTKILYNMMATIKIERKNEYNNRMRDYKIFIDGQQVGTIANRETKEFTTSAGQHTIAAKIDWCSSPDVVVAISENGTKRLKVGGFKNGNWMLPFALCIIVLHFILKATLHIDYVIFLSVPALLLLFYYLTLGRKKYLTLDEIPA